MIVDLHCHSTCSDGLLSPTALVERAAMNKVGLLALTDHDEVSGLEESQIAAAQWGLRLIPGVEISVEWESTTLHIVGLNINPLDESLVMGLLGIRQGREERAQRMDKSLEAAGISGALAGARRYAKNPQLLSRSHFARYLVEAGHARDTHAVFRNFLTPGKPGFVAHQWTTLAEAVSWIRLSGGVAVIAHPGRYDINQQKCDRLLNEFIALGGKAIEVVTGSHSPEEFVVWAKYAKRFGLKASVGSDFHGPGEGYRDIGNVPVLPAGCEPIWTEF